MNKQRHVLLVLGWYDYRLHKGIAEYAQEHGWHLSANLARERVIPWGWRGDGVLAWLGAGDDLAEFVESVCRPTVDFSLRRPNPRFARVLQDHAHAARLVADHFLTRGFKNFAFFSDAENWSFDERGRGFVAALKKAGHDCAWIKWHESAAFRGGRGEWSKRRAWLAAQLKRVMDQSCGGPPLKWGELPSSPVVVSATTLGELGSSPHLADLLLKRAPKPLALFAANDHLATDVLESCDAAGLRVPEQVAIVGAGDYLLAAEAMRTPLSSVDINLEEQGYEGAEMLDRLMGGARAPREPLRIPAARVVTRKSSDILAVNEPRVAKALRFIREHFREPICVDDVARASAMSRRALHQAFLDHLGRAPGEQIRNVRLEHAKKLLAETNHKIAAIAGLSGHQSANSFCVTFTKAEGFSPAAFRKSIRHRV